MFNRAQSPLGPGDFSLGQVHEAFIRLGKAGLTRGMLQDLVEKPELVKRLVMILSLGAYRPTQREQLARALMAPRYFGVEECIEQLNSDLLDGGRRQPPEFPWDMDVLMSPCPFNPGKKIYETHVVFLGMEMMIQDWRHPLYEASNETSGRVCFTDLHCITWHGEKFFLTRTDFKWYLMPIDTGDFFVSATLAQQLAKLPEAYEVAPAVVEVSRIGICYLATGQNPTVDQPRRCLETNNLYSRGHRIAIGSEHVPEFRIPSLHDGPPGPGHITIGPHFPKDDEVKANLSLAVMRK